MMPVARLGARARVRCVLVVAVAVVALLAAVGVGSPPTSAATAMAFDYTKVRNLSQPRHEAVKESLLLPVAEGVSVYLEVTRPNAKGRFPVILESSPYHGTLADREGTRILPEPRDANGVPVGLTGYFVPRGYAVVMMDLRGTGKSQGCLDHLGPEDATDIKAVVEWAAQQLWSNGRVGMTGHSYVGSTPSLAAASRPAGLVTIVPSAGLATMYDHQFQAGVPFFLQWAGPMFAYEQIALQRHLPGGESFGTRTEETGCGLPNSSLTSGEDQLSGRYADPWHAERDWAADATKADIPVFMVHGVNDNAARVTGMQWFTDRGGRASDKLWLGQWDHGSGCCPTRRGIQWTYALHAWFDKHLAQRNVTTGPPVELFLSDGTFQGARTGDRTQILLPGAWPAPGASTLSLYPTAGGNLAPAVPPQGKAEFAGDPRGFTNPQGTGGVEFATDPVASDLVLAGQPQLDLVASVTVERVHLIATLYDESPAAAGASAPRRRIGQFAINPELRNGIDMVTPVVPNVPMAMQPPGFAMAHDLRVGHRLVLRVTASDPDKVPTFAVDPAITVHTNQPATGLKGQIVTALRVPVVTSPTLVTDDVPFQLRPKKAGLAQATIRGFVTPPLPGAGTRRAGVTSEFLEFTVKDGKDNAELIVGAVPAASADVDLYLQRKQDDGSWSRDLTSGTSGSLTEEQLRFSRPAPGLYRVEAHNWAGPPATRIDLTLEFVNSDGTAGP